jgi:hypothetical protein
MRYFTQDQRNMIRGTRMSKTATRYSRCVEPNTEQKPRALIETRNGKIYVALALVPVLLGMLLQFILAPGAPAWGFYEVVGIGVAVFLCGGRAILAALHRHR